MHRQHSWVRARGGAYEEMFATRGPCREVTRRSGTWSLLPKTRVKVLEPVAQQAVVGGAIKQETRRLT